MVKPDIKDHLYDGPERAHIVSSGQFKSLASQKKSFICRLILTFFQTVVLTACQ